MIEISNFIYIDESKFKNLTFVCKRTDPQYGSIDVTSFGSLTDAIEYKLKWEDLGSVVTIFHLQEFNELGPVQEVS